MQRAACKSFLANGNIVSDSGAALKLWILPGGTSWSWYKSNCGMTLHELPPSIHFCHLPNLPDKSANFPITCGAIRYQRASQFLNGKQEQTFIKPEMCLLPLWFRECPWGRIDAGLPGLGGPSQNFSCALYPCHSKPQPPIIPVCAGGEAGGCQQCFTAAGIIPLSGASASNLP